MVSTRTNILTPVPTMESVQESISELRDAIVEIKEGMKAFLINQKVVSDEIKKLKNVEVEISSHIRMFTLDTLIDVYYLAKMQEQTIMAMKSRYGSILNTPKTVSNVFNKYANGYQRPSGTNAVIPNTTFKSNATPFRKRLTQKELEDKRANHMYFYCDEKYFPGHKCSGQLHSLEVIIDEEEDEGDEVFEECVTELLTHESPNDFVNDARLQISIHALVSITSYQTMRIRSYVGKQMVHILINCGSTRSLVKTTKRMGCKLQTICPLKVDMADGNSLTSSFLSKNFKWTIQGLNFMIDIMVIPLGGCEMVLGMQCLATLGDIMFNFQKLTMKFEYSRSKVLLRGTPQSSINWMQGNSRGSRQGSAKHSCKAVAELLEEYADASTNSPNQKDAIELMVKELLDSGVIRPSQSPFSSPIVMVKKKDDTWRMCVDYRQLNKHTVKDKCLIPMIEELIDEFKDEAEHLQYLKCILQVMRENALYAKQSKCAFAVSEVEYLRHVISAKGVATDKSKILAMKGWPIPKIGKQLRGFLGLSGYYRIFIRYYAIIKFEYNTNFHTSINTTPFEVVYGQKPRIHLPYLAGESTVEAVDRSILAREQVLNMLKFHLKRAQDRMLKECKGDVSTMGELLVCDNKGQLSAVPVAILERRLGKVNN
ncbi:reverse transcriptase [Tanacetum coccineum]